jgi:heme/copper-type cytochrome/quinol oxidase subunit 2
MQKKKILKIIAIIISIIVLIIIALYAYASYQLEHKFIPDNNIHTTSAEYIDPKAAFLNEDFEVCNEDFIIQYYNPQRATYSKGKNGLRQFIMSNYNNKSYTDSGYLNIRFIINCKGKAGRYIIHENDLDLNPVNLNEDLVNQLFKLTTQLEDWNPNYVYDEYRDSYMYISYRIEHGEITEIIP